MPRHVIEERKCPESREAASRREQWPTDCYESGKVLDRLIGPGHG